jgi:hypothetical protein
MRVMLPIRVVAACQVTIQSRDGSLSKKCQVQAHMALMSEGSMPQESDRQALYPVTSA